MPFLHDSLRAHRRISSEIISYKLLFYADDAELYHVISESKDSAILLLKINKFLNWALVNESGWESMKVNVTFYRLLGDHLL